MQYNPIPSLYGVKLISDTHSLQVKMTIEVILWFIIDTQQGANYTVTYILFNMHYIQIVMQNEGFPIWQLWRKFPNSLVLKHLNPFSSQLQLITIEKTIQTLQKKVIDLETIHTKPDKWNENKTVNGDWDENWTLPR